MNKYFKLLIPALIFFLASTVTYAAVQGPVYGTLGHGTYYARYETYQDSYRGTSEYYGFSEGYAKDILKTQYLRYPGYHPSTGFYGVNYGAIIYRERQPVLYPGLYRFMYRHI